MAVLDVERGLLSTSAVKLRVAAQHFFLIDMSRAPSSFHLYSCLVWVSLSIDKEVEAGGTTSRSGFRLRANAAQRPSVQLDVRMPSLLFPPSFPIIFV